MADAEPIRLRAATIFVNDRERSARFYVDVLGCRREHGDGAEVTPPGSSTSFLLVQPSLSEMGAERASVARQRIGEPTGLVLEVGDIDEVYGRLRAHGVNVGPAPVRDDAGVAATTFCDPDGNSFTLVQAPNGVHGA